MTAHKVLKQTDQATLRLYFVNVYQITSTCYIKNRKFIKKNSVWTFKKYKIDFENLFDKPFDCASSKKETFNGLQEFIKQRNENSIYMWCYADKLNLSMCVTYENLAAKKFFELLNFGNTFSFYSYKHMDVWKQTRKKLGTGIQTSEILESLKKLKNPIGDQLKKLLSGYLMTMIVCIQQ